MAEILNGTEYGLKGQIFEIKRGATWKETFLFEGNLTAGTFKGYLCRKKEDELLAEFSFSTPEFGNFVDENGEILEGFTRIDVSLGATHTASLPLTLDPPRDPQRAGRDFWEADIELVTGAIVTPLLSAIVYVIGQCQGGD